MFPDSLSFLTKFDKFYQELINLAKENKINEQEFYMIIIAKAKAMDRERLNQKKNLRENSKWGSRNFWLSYTEQFSILFSLIQVVGKSIRTN